MPNYYVSHQSQINGDHEVHAQNCMYLPRDLQYLGNFASCDEALSRARELYRQINGCFWCARSCHTEHIG